MAPGVRDAGSAYAERAEEQEHWHDRVADGLLTQIVRPLLDRVMDPAARLRRVVELAAAHGEALATATDAELRDRVPRLRAALRRRRFDSATVAECFALVREVAGRSVGQRPFDVQLMGGWALLQGTMIEMQTGEGKTLTATLPACAAALAGIPVHVITVNDYLAGRDAETMGPIYAFLGLSVGVVVQGMPPEARRAAYACDVTYCSNKELAFDYLRDRTVLMRRGSRLHLALEKLRGERQRAARLVLRGLHFGIVDEADSVLIDEARTPLLLASTGSDTGEQEICGQALEMARALATPDAYLVDERHRVIRLTENGKRQVAERAEQLPGVWTSARGREELITQGLSALTLYHRDQHYVVTEGKVHIVDEFTGRIMPDRSWERGLHQMIEAKEQCQLTPRSDTVARITYQRLFRRYLRLAGMSGTAREVAPELWSVFGLRVLRIPLNRPSRRRVLPGTLFRAEQDKWRAVAELAARVSREDARPVLIGTRSVKASEELSRMLRELDVAHALLNAKQDREEADIIAAAGQAGRVTVATNMAGRGTDIRLAPGVAERGGLLVILTECHESRRIDRQLFGRCGRQGDPGSCTAMVSLDDELFRTFAPALRALFRRSGGAAGIMPRWMLGALRLSAQAAAERRNAGIRSANLKEDQRLEKLLAFSGRHE